MLTIAWLLSADNIRSVDIDCSKKLKTAFVMHCIYGLVYFQSMAIIVINGKNTPKTIIPFRKLDI